jgi:hypothetical protein
MGTEDAVIYSNGKMTDIGVVCLAGSRSVRRSDDARYRPKVRRRV